MAKSAPKIVARNFHEAHAFARDVLKLSRGSYRVVTSPASLVGVSGEIHLVPGWDKRADRWAMKQKLKYTRLEVTEHPINAEPAEEQEPTNGDNMISEGSPVFTIFSDAEAWLKETEHSLRPADSGPLFVVPEDLLQEIAESDDKPAEEQEVDEDVEPEPAPTDADEGVKEQEPEEDERPLNGRRRRRCKECGELIHPDDVEEHAAAEEAKKAALEKKAQENLR